MRRCRRRRREAVYGRATAGDVKDSQADITRARTLLGYEPLGVARGRVEEDDRAGTGSAAN